MSAECELNKVRIPMSKNHHPRKQVFSDWLMSVTGVRVNTTLRATVIGAPVASSTLETDVQSQEHDR